MIGTVAALLALQSPARPPADPRTLEIVRETCESRIASRETILYANGTIRLREGPAGELRLTLGELGRPDAEAIEKQLREIDPAALEVVSTAPEGEWVERCQVRVTPRDARAYGISYAPLDAGSLELEKLRRIVDYLASLARDDGGSIEIPFGYRPRPGDLLERADGAVFRVVGFTSDNRAVELVSDSPPITVFVERDRVRAEFRRLVRRASPP